MPVIPNRLRRRAGVALAAVAAAALLAGCSSSGSTPSSTSGTQTINFQTSWIPLVQFGGSYVAAKEGYYAKQGVDVKILPGGPDTDGLALLESGKADIAVSNADVVAQANSQGANLVIIGAGFQKSPLAIMSLASSPIETPADMKGKKIGVPSGDESTHAAFLSVNGLTDKQVTSVPVSFDVTPTTSGQVAGQYVFATEQPISAEEAGFKTHSMLLADYGLNVYAQVYVVTKDYLKSHRVAVEDFMKGEIEGWQAYVKDQTEAVDLTVHDYGKDQKLTVANQTEQAKLQLPLLETDTTKAHGLFWMSDADIAANLKTIKALGISADSSLFDTSVLKDIYKGQSSID
ncbi:ABC transporter substrate-binding protein [Gryllotalpicola koreensis]|uniref:Thiamine pyrimidine synthase n=1 Tax=Gryllotalpicola koreensis TaxID=993086 RepID=A0ABP8A160_9MICO